MTYTKLYKKNITYNNQNKEKFKFPTDLNDPYNPVSFEENYLQFNYGAKLRKKNITYNTKNKEKFKFPTDLNDPYNPASFEELYNFSTDLKYPNNQLSFEEKFNFPTDLNDPYNQVSFEENYLPFNYGEAILRKEEKSPIGSQAIQQQIVRIHRERDIQAENESKAQDKLKTLKKLKLVRDLQNKSNESTENAIKILEDEIQELSKTLYNINGY